MPGSYNVYLNAQTPLPNQIYCKDVRITCFRKDPFIAWTHSESVRVAVDISQPPIKFTSPHLRPSTVLYRAFLCAGLASAILKNETLTRCSATLCLHPLPLRSHHTKRFPLRHARMVRAPRAPEHRACMVSREANAQRQDLRRSW